MTVQVVDPDQRQAPRVGDGAGGAHADEQRADEPRAARHRDTVDGVPSAVQPGHRALDDRDDGLEVGARGELGHDASVGRVDGDLARDDVHQHPALLIHHRRGGLVAATLDAEHAHQRASRSSSKTP